MTISCYTEHNYMFRGLHNSLRKASYYVPDLKVRIFRNLCVSKLCNDFVKHCSTFGKPMKL